MKTIKVIKPGEVIVCEKKLDSKINPNELLIKMKAVGICGSDMHIYNGKSAFAVYPNIMGHELAGEVYAIGEHVEEFKIGDKVVINNVLSCGHCFACRKGQPNVCREVKVLGVHVEGGFQEFIKVKKESAFKISRDISWDIAATVEPYAIAAEVVERGKLSKIDTVLICGAGPLGLIIMQVVKMFGNKVIMLDINQKRLDIARELGSDIVINTAHQEAVKVIMENTDNEGASLIIEATGNTKVLEQCVSEYVSQAGKIVVLGFSKNNISISPFDIMRRELEIIGSRLNNNKFPTVIEWLEKGVIDPRKIITNKFHFTQAKEAFDFINEQPEQVIKVILEFD